jgi:hypothetical protein
VSTIGITLGLQGWNSGGINFDHVNYIDGADNLLSTGTLPDRGDVSSYGSFATPGTAWLMVPGMLVFSDPRLFEVVGSVSLYLGTLFGLFMLARMCFGVYCASLSVLLYGLSRSGLFYAESLWSIGHPFFYVWMVYFCIQWVRREDANYLAAAVVTWSIGMYVDMVIAPALFILPAMWLFYGPPLRLRPLLIAAAIILAIWYPYLKFQMSRDFVDLRSMVFRQRIWPANYQDTWCNPTLALQRWKHISSVSNGEMHQSFLVTSDISSPTEVRTSHPNLLQAAGSRLASAVEGLRSNFEQMTSISRTSVPLLILVLISLAIMSLLPFAGAAAFIDRQRFWLYWITRFAWTLLLGGLVLNEFFIARFLSVDGTLESSTISSIRRLQIVCLLSAIALLILRNRLATLLNRPTMSAEAEVHSPARSQNVALFALCLLVPWFIMLLVAEPGRPDRYWWLWPLQVVVLIAAVTYLPERLRLSSPLARIAQIGFTLLLLLHPALLSRVQAWLRTGWSGPTAKTVEVVDYVASQVRSEGKNSAAIGYQTFIYGFMAKSNVIDPRYKVGAGFDMLLKHRHGLLNTDRCAEGVSSDDEYRIVQIRPKQPDEPKDFFNDPPEEYFNVPLHGTFQLLRQFGDYQVFKRID